jgi:lipopolysaccharide heptosyltransferase II
VKTRKRENAKTKKLAAVRVKTAVETTQLVSSFIIQRIRYRRSPPHYFQPRKILVIKLDHLGDVLLATPIFTNLRRVYPEAEIHALIGSWSAVVLQNRPDVDRMITYDAPFFCRGKQPTSLQESVRLLRTLRREGYDLLVELRGDWLTVCLALFARASYRLDLAALRASNRLGRFQFSGAHEVERNLDLLRSAHIPISCCTPDFRATVAEQQWADHLLSALGIDKKRPLIAIHPGSPATIKRWRPERFATLADWLIEHKRAQILFVGVSAESPIVEAIQKQMRNASLNIAGKTTFPQLAEVLRRCNLFIGNDSGPMHLAAAVGARTIGLYGPGDPNRFGPVGAHCWTIRRKLNCPPCMEESCKFGGEGCMKEIMVDDVIQTINGLL